MTVPQRTLYDVERDRDELQAVSDELRVIRDADLATPAAIHHAGSALETWIGSRDAELRAERLAFRRGEDPRAKRIAELEASVQRLSKAYEEVQTGYKPSNSASLIASGFADQWGSIFGRWDGSIEFTVDVSTTGGMGGWRFRCLRPDGSVITDDHAGSLGEMDYVTGAKNAIGAMVFALVCDPHAYDGLEEEIAAGVWD